MPVSGFNRSIPRSVMRKSIVATGMYNDTLVKTANGWRFKSRATKMDAAAPPAPASAPK
jgi:hypothetical protein